MTVSRWRGQASGGIPFTNLAVPPPTPLTLRYISLITVSTFIFYGKALCFAVNRRVR